MNIKVVLLIMIIVLTFVSGCSETVRKVPIEESGMIGTIAFDYMDESTMRLTAAIPQYYPEAKEKTQVFSTTTKLVSDGIVELEAFSDKEVVLNQLRVVLFNEEFAQHGKVPKVIKHLYRNPEVGNKVLIAIVKGNGEEILKGKYPDKPNLNFYLNDLLRPSINTAFNPNTNIHDFMYTQTNPVFDSIIPLIEKKEEQIEIVGITLFKDKEMVKVLTKDETLIIQALQGQKKLAPISLSLHQGHGEEHLLLDLVNSNVKMKSNKSMKAPKLTITLKIEGTLIEYMGKRDTELKQVKNMEKLEDDISKQIEQDIETFIDKLKELEVDPIGLSENFRMYHNGKWEKEMTREIMKKVEVEMVVETSIINKGTIK